MKFKLFLLNCLFINMVMFISPEISSASENKVLWGNSSDSLTNSGTLSEAVSQSPAYIQLSDDISLSEPVYFEDTENITLDLNGKTIDIASESISSMETMFEINRGELTVSDSVGGGEIISQGDACVMHISNSGALTINGGKFESAENHAVYVSDSSLVVNNGIFTGGTSRTAVYVANGGEAILNHGKFTGDKYSVYLYANSMLYVKDAILKGTSAQIQLASNGAEIDFTQATADSYSVYVSAPKAPVSNLILAQDQSIYSGNTILTSGRLPSSKTVSVKCVNKTHIYNYDYENKQVTVTSTESGTFTLVFVDYENGIAVNLDLCSVSLTANTPKTIPQSNKNFTLAGGDKIMLWNFSSISPLCPFYTVN